jgi:O-antigen ligase
MTSDKPRPKNRVSSFLLFLTVAAAPFPFGSTAPSAIAFWCIVLGLGAIALSPLNLRKQHLPLVGVLVIIVLASAFVLHEQLAADPWIARFHPVWASSAEVLQTPVAPSASIARNQPLLALGAPLANLLALICSFVISLDSARARQLLRVVAWSGAAYAIYGVAAYLIDPGHILWHVAPPLHTFSSTFEYRSTACVYFGACAVLWLQFSLEHVRERLPLDSVYWKGDRALFLLELPFSSLLMLLVCMAAVLMTISRSGAALSFGALAVGAYCFFYRDLKRRRLLGAAVLIAAIAAFAAFEIMGADVAQRLQLEGLVDQGRADVYRAMLKLIADHPWFGTGLGTFLWSFPEYRSGFSMWGVWEFAHNTPLELAGDLGIPLVSLIAVAWVIVLVALGAGVRNRRKNRIAPAGAFAVTTLFLAHSFIDFSAQIPGYAMTVFAVVGAGLAQSFSTIPSNRRVIEQETLTSHKGGASAARPVDNLHHANWATRNV